MPPIFVDGVEIGELFVDGVEQAEAFVDGVEVFSAGEEMFDDFERSGNGTLIQNHAMNTGQSWIALLTAGFLNGNIQTYKGQRQSFVTQVSTIAAALQTNQPVFDEGFPAGLHARVVGHWTRDDVANNSFARLEIRSANDVNRCTVMFIFDIENNNSRVFMSTDLGILQEIPVPGVNVTAEVEIFWDGTDFQGRVTVPNGGVITTTKFPARPNMAKIQVSVQEQFFGNQTKQNGMSEFQLDGSSPGGVPFP